MEQPQGVVVTGFAGGDEHRRDVGHLLRSQGGTRDTRERSEGQRRRPAVDTDGPLLVAELHPLFVSAVSLVTALGAPDVCAHTGTGTPRGSPACCGTVC